MQGMPSILSVFRNEFNKFNNTGTQIFDSIYYETLKYLKCAFLVQVYKSENSLTLTVAMVTKMAAKIG